MTKKRNANTEINDEYTRACKKPLLICELEPDGTVIYVNDAVSDLTGYSKEELRGCNWFKKFYPGSEVEQVKELYRLFELGDVVNYSMRLKAKDGSERLLKWNSSNVYAENGDLEKIVGVGVKTEPVSVEDNVDVLRQESPRFAIDNPNMIMRVSRDGKILYANDASKPMLKEWRCRVGQDAPLAVKELVLRSLGATDTEIIIEATCGDLYYTFLFKPSALSDGVNIFGSDITYLKKAQDALAASEEKYRILVNNSPEGIARLGMEGEFLLVNKKFLELSGLDEESFKKKGIDVFFEFCGEDDVQQLAAKLFESLIEKKRTSFEYRIKNRRGEILWISQLVYPWQIGNDDVGGVEIIARDITEIKRAEQEKRSLLEQLYNSKKLEAVGVLAGGIAHDFNNMLAVIIGNAQLGLRHIKEVDNGYVELKEVLNAAEIAKELSMKLLSLARKDKYNMRLIDANKVVEGLSGIISKVVPKRVDLKMNMGNNSPCGIMADESRLHHALLNICDNAMEAMANGGELRIGTGVVTIDRENLPSPEMQPGNYCMIEISDTGIGIDSADITRIFDPFFTTKPKKKGTGLGLFITFSIVKNHNGYIVAESTKGAGTTFRLYFKTVEWIAQESAPVSRVKSHEGDAHGTIMVVDDESSVLMMTSRVLKDLGYSVITADSGVRAIELYIENKSAIDVVVLDIIMPEMDGPEVFSALKMINPNVKVLISSGFSMDRQMEELRDMGVKGFIQKPFTVSGLSDKLNEILMNR